MTMTVGRMCEWVHRSVCVCAHACFGVDAHPIGRNPTHLSDLFDLVREIRGVGDHHLGPGGFAARCDARHFAVAAEFDVVDRLVQHVRAAVDGAESAGEMEAVGIIAQQLVSALSLRRTFSVKYS